MDYNSLKAASDIFDSKFVSKTDLNSLLDDSSDYYILRNIPEPHRRRTCQDIIKSSMLSNIRDGKVLIPANLIISEIVRHLTAECVDLKDYDVSESRISLTLASTKWFIGFIKPKMWFRIDKITLNSEEQTAVVEYFFDGSIMDFLVKEAVNYYSRPYITVIEKTDLGGRIIVNLKGYVQEFEEKAYVKELKCSVFDIVSFSSVQHSMDGIKLICDQTWADIVRNINMRLDVIEEQKATKIPSVWMMHRD